MSCITTVDFESHAWGNVPADMRREIRDLLDLFRNAPDKGVARWLQDQAHATGISEATLRRKYYSVLSSGGDWTCLIDARRVIAHKASIARTQRPAFRAELLRMVEKHQRKNLPAFKALKIRWRDRRVAVPGYEDWAGWPKVPAGWSNRNLARIVESETNLARMRSVRVGTSSKTNPFLPTVLTTRVGLWPGAFIQLDDVFHDNLVTLGKRRDIVRVMELGAMDVYSACRFHFGAKPRRRTESGGWENIRMTDMRMFLAGMFHTFGYSPRGTMLMSEHNTAKVQEDIARSLYDATRGLVRVEYQPIEGKQAALSGFWHGTEGGNFRAKALLESTHNLIHNDLAALPMQTGSPSSGLAAPVNTDRIVNYIAGIIRDVLKAAPHRLDLLRLPTLDFHTQFFPLLQDYYEFGLNGRTEHQLEGWEKLGHVINEYTFAPGCDKYITESLLLTMPETTQLAIREAARMAPDQWSRRRNLAPQEVWNRREKFQPIAPVVIADMLGQDLARELTARRGFIEFSDQEISADPLIYQARYISGPRAGMEIHHGEKVSMFVLPFDDSTAIVMDAKGVFLGEVPLYKRVLPIDPSAFQTSAPFEARPDVRSAELTRAAGEKHSRIADILEPSRILHREEVREARELREHNRKLISGEPVTEEEIHAARSAAADKAVTTRRINEWAADMPEDLPADLMQPDCESPANAIGDDQIAEWLND